MIVTGKERIVNQNIILESMKQKGNRYYKTYIICRGLFVLTRGPPFYKQQLYLMHIPQRCKPGSLVSPMSPIFHSNLYKHILDHIGISRSKSNLPTSCVENLHMPWLPLLMKMCQKYLCKKLLHPAYKFHQRTSKEIYPWHLIHINIMPQTTKNIYLQR